MARIRTIKPEFFMSEQVGAISHTARLLFIGLWTLADREGRLEWKPRRIRAQVFPYEDDLQVFTFAEELVTSGLLAIYEDSDGVYAHIPGFTRHQRPHPKEPDSDIPPPPTDGTGVTPWAPSVESVYFVRNTVSGAIKIGRSRRPDIRFKELQTSAEVPLEMLCTVPPTVANERELHQRFKAHRMVGEWFQPVKELTDLITTFTKADSHPCIPSSPVGREGKGMDKGKEIWEGVSSAPAPVRIAPLIESPLSWDRKHGGHVPGFCDWVCLPGDLAEQFGGRAGWELAQVTSWAESVREKWQASGRVPAGKMYDFWNDRWTEQHGAAKPKHDWKAEVLRRAGESR